MTQVVLPGQLFGAYAVDHKIGEGGMGEVFDGLHLETGRRVAIKVIKRPNEQEWDPYRRFKKEVEALRNARSPNVVDIIDWGLDPRPYIVMERLCGETLRALLRREHYLTVEKAVQIGIDVCSGLDVAHGFGIIHRDLKPENVFITENSTKLLDFGVAKFAASETSSNLSSGLPVGTLRYMAPEQIRADTIDPRSDVYAVGAILYECLTGTPAFDAREPYRLLFEVLHQEPSPLVSRGGGLPSWLEGVVMKCLSKNPSLRPPTASALRNILASRTFVADRAQDHARVAPITQCVLDEQRTDPTNFPLIHVDSRKRGHAVSRSVSLLGLTSLLIPTSEPFMGSSAPISVTVEPLTPTTVGNGALDGPQLHTESMRLVNSGAPPLLKERAGAHAGDPRSTPRRQLPSLATSSPPPEPIRTAPIERAIYQFPQMVTANPYTGEPPKD